MKRKTLSSILVIGLICTSLTGCVSFSYENPVKEETYVAELPDGEVVVLDKEEAEELQRAQDELQEELGISDEELAKLQNEIGNYEERDEDNEEEHTEPSVEQEEPPFDFNEFFGDPVGKYESLGCSYQIYENGAILKEFLDEFGAISEFVEYEGKTYPVIGMYTINREDFTIPSYIQYIGHPTGDDYRAIISGKSVVIPDTVTYIINAQFTKGLENVVLPQNIISGKKWTYTFQYCTNLQSVVIPEGVEELDCTFQGCENLTSVTLPSTLKIIGNAAFYECDNLTEINIPKGVTTIDGNAFSYCKNLKSITIPDSVTSIGLTCFDAVEELILPDSVTEIDGLPSDSEALRTLVFPDNLSNTDFELGYYPNLELVVFPDGVLNIEAETDRITNPSNCTFQVPESTVEYFKNKFPEINVVAKD